MTNTDKTVSAALTVEEIVERMAWKLCALENEVWDETDDSFKARYRREAAQMLAAKRVDQIADALLPRSRTQEPVEWLDPDGWCEKAAIHGGRSGIAASAPEIAHYKMRRLSELGAAFTVTFKPSSGWFIETPPAPERSKEEVVTVDGMRATICEALLDAFPMADKVADNYAAVAAKAVAANAHPRPALEPSPIQGEAVAKLTVQVVDGVSAIASVALVPGPALYQLPDGEYSLFSSPHPVTISHEEGVRATPDHAFLHGVCDSLRAAISEYEDRGLYPGARKIMQVQIDALTAALSVKPGEQG